MDRRLFLLSFCLILALPSCGRRGQRVDVRDESFGEILDPNCTKANCSAVDYGIVDSHGNALESSVFTGQVGVPLEWGVALKTNGRVNRVKLAILESPLWLKKSTSFDPGTLVLTGTPVDLVSKGVVTILARDMSRCAVNEARPKDCLIVEKDFEGKYDKKFTMAFSITGTSLSDSSGLQGAGGSVLPNQGSNKCNPMGKGSLATSGQILRNSGLNSGTNFQNCK